MPPYRGWPSAVPPARRVGPKTNWAALSTVALALGVLLAGCNLFSPLASDARGDLTYEGLLLKGDKAINDGDYPAAEGWFARAMQLNYRGSEAYLFDSKALAAEYKIDYTTLNDEFNKRRNKDGTGSKGIPFIDSNTSIEKIDSTYYPVAQSVENLEHILRHARDTVVIPGGWKLLPDGDTAGDGHVSEGVARLDLGLLETIKGMLGALDLDGDNHVSRDCGRNICPDDGSAEACRATPAYKAKCPEGPASELNRFERFKLLTQDINIDSLNSNDVQAKQISSNPNDINDFLDHMQGPIAASSYNLDSVTGAMNAHNETKLSGQLTDIVTDVSNLSDFLSFMRYNDHKDNDFDTQDTTRTDPMVWHDYDRDHGIRYDYDDSLTFLKYVSAGIYDAGNIGHPLHRYHYPNLYVKFTDPGWLKRPVALDSSKNSRKSIMINHCVDVVSKLAIDDALKFQLQTVTCSTYTTILKPSVRPPVHNGVVRSDWQGGTYGIDEEMFDDHDNDYDGLKDEDARNAKGMDDDDDGNLTVDMIGTPPPPMVWHDVAGHQNDCPDMDTLRAMPPPPFQRKFCIGSLENRIYLAQHYGDDSLLAYYSPVLNVGESGKHSCLDDVDRLPADYKAAAAQEPNSTMDFKDATIKACQYKHIWKSGIPPPNSEWTSGTFGVDEEILDGIDNDGDGWIDEDVR